jgi:hypothetical protein
MSRAIKATALSVLVVALFTACDELPSRKQTATPGGQPSIPTGGRPAAEHRFVFPPQAGTFPAAAVALDTETGRLCKTYPWADSQSSPRPLPLCSELAALTAPAVTSLLGARKHYLGFTYSFDGSKWRKGPEANLINLTTDKTEPLSDDQYDPLNLFSAEAKAKRVLTATEIRNVADQFGVSYYEAWKDAKAHGYQVPNDPNDLSDLGGVPVKK